MYVLLFFICGVFPCHFQSLEHILKRNPNLLLKYNLVIVTTLQRKVLLELADFLWQNDIPLIVCKSYGMIGYLRLVTQNHTGTGCVFIETTVL